MFFQEAFEWKIAVYLFLAGTGAGAIVSGAVSDIHEREKYISYIKAASLIGMPLVAFGTLFLLIDLGQGLWKPWLLIYLFANPKSVITWGTIILTLFIICTTFYGAYNLGIIKFGGGKAIKVLSIGLGLATAGYTAILIGVLRAIPFWHQSVLAILFLVSALSTGISATVVVRELFFKDESHTEVYRITHFYSMIIEIFLFLSLMFVAFNGVPEMVFSAKTIFFGSFRFWVWVLLVGIIIPATLHRSKKLHFDGYRLIIIESMVLIGGFNLRLIIIQAGAYTDKFVNCIWG